MGQVVMLDYPNTYPIEVANISVSGLYYVRIITGTGDLYIGKLIVK